MNFIQKLTFFYIFVFAISSCRKTVDYINFSKLLIENKTTDTIYFKGNNGNVEISPENIEGIAVVSEKSSPSNMLPNGIILYKDSLGIELEVYNQNPVIDVEWKEVREGNANESSTFFYTLTIN